MIEKNNKTLTSEKNASKPVDPYRFTNVKP